MNKKTVSRVLGRRGSRPPMKERNRLRVGVIGTLLVVLVLALIFNYRSMVGFVTDSTYRADFADASGLYADDEVKVAGVVVGKVTAVELAGDHVDVEFSADTGGISLGGETRAAIKVSTLLGERYLELIPAGTGSLAEGSTIPRERTVSGYDIARSLEEVTGTVARTDEQEMTAALGRAGKLLQELTPQLDPALTSLTELSNTVSARDTALRSLLAHAAGVSDILAQRNQQFVVLLGDGQRLFDALNARAAAIHNILVQARLVFDELSAIARDNAATIGPTLAQLGTTLDLLNKNHDNLNRSISGLSTFVTQLSDVVASGPFFNVLLHNITPANLAGQQPSSPGAPR